MRLDARQPDDADTGLLSRRFRLALGLLLLAGLPAGCGGAADRAETPRCPAGPGSALARAVGAPRVAASAPERSPGFAACRYAAGRTRISIAVDSAPQAFRRWSNSQVERWQVAVGWSHTPSQAPRVVSHVGAGAFWVSGPRELVATDRRRIVTVRVVRAAGAPPRALAVGVAKAALRTASF